jgi:hypothetical protein
MADIGVLWTHPTVALPRNDIGRSLVDWAAKTLHAIRAMVRTPDPRNRPERRYYHPRRESFLEDAAMSREMYRL